MPEFVTVRMLTKSQVQAALQALPDSNPLRKSINLEKVQLLDLGARQLKTAFRSPSGINQSISMEYWDGVSDPVDMRDILNRDPAALAANRGRIKFIATAEVLHSIEFGSIKKYVEAGILLVEGYSQEPAAGGLPIIVHFSFNTASPLKIADVALGGVVYEAEVTIENAFDDVAASLELGIPGTPDLIFAAGDIDPTSPATYGNDENFQMVAPTSIELTINPGASTQGSGFVLLKVG